MILIATLAVVLTWWFQLAWWVPLAAVWGYWLVLLPVLTWRDFLAGMNYARVSRGNAVTLPQSPDEIGNEPDADRVVRYVLWPGGALHNFFSNVIWASLYFRDPPRWEAGLTMRLNRYVAGPDGWRKDRALAIRKRWLNRYDPRGVHTS